MWFFSKGKKSYQLATLLCGLLDYLNKVCTMKTSKSVKYLLTQKMIKYLLDFTINIPALHMSQQWLSNVVQMSNGNYLPIVLRIHFHMVCMHDLGHENGYYWGKNMYLKHKYFFSETIKNNLK